MMVMLVMKMVMVVVVTVTVMMAMMMVWARETAPERHDGLKTPNRTGRRTRVLGEDKEGWKAGLRKQSCQSRGQRPVRGLSSGLGVPGKVSCRSWESPK